jgi:hypothetical protein
MAIIGAHMLFYTPEVEAPYSRSQSSPSRATDTAITGGGCRQFGDPERAKGVNRAARTS